MKLRGGLVKSVPGSQILTLLFALVVVHLVLAALMWSNVIQFAANDTKIIVSTTLTVAGVILVVYMLYLATASS